MSAGDHSQPIPGSYNSSKTPPKDPSLIDIIVKVAKSLGVPPELALAIAYHESGLNPYAVGDNGTSFGLYQLHEGGELGNHSKSWAFNVYHNALTSLTEVKRTMERNPGADWGQIAAMAQRPADQAAYSASIDNILSDSGNNIQWFASKNKYAAQPYTAATEAQYQKIASTGSGGGDDGAGTAQLSESQLEAGLNKDGFAIGLIDSVPELKQVFKTALSQNYSVDQTMLAIQNTHWFQNHNASQRQFLEMEHSDPAQLQRKLQQTQDDLKQMSTQLGIPIEDLHGLARSIVYNGLDQQEQTAAIVSGFRYRGQALTGQVGSDVDALKNLASNYYVNMDDKQLTDMTKRMVTGQLDPTAVTDFFKNQALGMFPYLKQQINQGLTVADVASPYKQEMARLWNDDPNSAQNIKNMDPTILKALQQPTAEGTHQLMPIWQFQEMLRQDPRWLKTVNARDSLMDSATGLLANMGLISGGVNVGALGSQAGNAS